MEGLEVLVILSWRGDPGEPLALKPGAPEALKAGPPPQVDCP